MDTKVIPLYQARAGSPMAFPFWLLHQDSLNENHGFPLEYSEFSYWVPLICQKLPFILNILVPEHYLLR